MAQTAEADWAWARLFLEQRDEATQHRPARAPAPRPVPGARSQQGSAPRAWQDSPTAGRPATSGEFRCAHAARQRNKQGRTGGGVELGTTCQRVVTLNPPRKADSRPAPAHGCSTIRCTAIQHCPSRDDALTPRDETAGATGDKGRTSVRRRRPHGTRTIPEPMPNDWAGVSEDALVRRLIASSRDEARAHAASTVAGADGAVGETQQPERQERRQRALSRRRRRRQQRQRRRPGSDGRVRPQVANERARAQRKKKHPTKQQTTACTPATQHRHPTTLPHPADDWRLGSQHLQLQLQATTTSLRQARQVVPTGARRWAKLLHQRARSARTAKQAKAAAHAAAPAAAAADQATTANAAVATTDEVAAADTV